MNDTTKCPQCGKEISNVEYIRYGGVCSTCWHKNDMAKTAINPEWLRVAKSLCADLDNDINVEARKLEAWGKLHNFTPDEVEELCDIDSVYMFRVIKELN